MANIVNYCKNPSFEVNITDDWTQTGDGTASQNLGGASHGSNCLKIVAGSAATNYRANTGVSVPNGATVTISGYGYGPADPAGGKATLQIWDSTGSAARGNIGFSVAATSGWERKEISWTNDTGLAATCVATCRNTRTDGAFTFYWDGIQLELQTAASAYTDGAQGEGHSWAGTAHNSVSTWTEPASAGSVSISPYMMV